MSDTNQPFLQQLSQRSQQQQQAFIKNISKRLGRESLPERPKHPYQGAPPFWKEYELELNERIDLFSHNWKAAGGHVYRFPEMQEVKRFIAGYSKELKAKLMIRQNQPELQHLMLEEELPESKVIVWDTTLNQDLPAYAAGADIGLTMVEYAVAHTGSMVVTSSEDKGRTVTLLPTVVMAIIPVERIKSRLGEVLSQFSNQAGKQLPAGIHFISGPSRSADIENDLTIGVHGPGVVYALIVG